MKRIILLSLLTLTSSLLTLSAAVPLRWTVETSRATPATFDAYQGETLAFEAALQSYGKPLAAPSEYALYWQTNGMGSTYWSVPCSQTFEHSEHSNILYATWSPTNDVGAKVYNCFIGKPGTIYHAAFQLRLRPSPGATPNELPLPTPVIDFDKVTVLNPPWSGGGVDTNAVERIANRAVETNAVTVGLQSSVSTLQSSKADKSNTYSKAETDTKLTPIETHLATLQDGKRDKTDLDVYSTVFTPWTCKEQFDYGDEDIYDFEMVFNAEESRWYLTVDGETDYTGGSSEDVNQSVLIIDRYFILKRSKTGIEPSGSKLAHTSATSGLAKFDADGELVAATPGADFLKRNELGIIEGGLSTDGTIDTPSEIMRRGAPVVYSVNGEYGDVSLDIPDPYVPSATDPVFSNAVLAVGLNIDTNAVATLNEIAATFGDFPITGTATTVGGLLAALAAAAAWLRKRAVHLDDKGLADDTFATDLLGKLVANAKVRYALATTASAAMADRTVNLYEMNGNGTITFPAATTHEGVTYARDFLLRVKVTTAGSLTLPTDVTPLGDSFDFTKANDWLIAFTEIGKDANNKAEFYIRAISLEG